METAAPLLSPSDAARQLGVSPRALRLYEERELLEPLRSAAGWRAYGPDQMVRARQIVELRTFGFKLAEIAKLLDGDAAVLERALLAHEVVLEGSARALHQTVQRIREARRELDSGTLPAAAAGSKASQASVRPDVSIELPWPWAGERFELREVRPLTHIVGPLGSGKTRLAMRLAEVIPGASFVSLDRRRSGRLAGMSRRAANEALAARARMSITAVIDAGGNASDALAALMSAIEDENASVHVVDMLEDGLDEATQKALICILRRRVGAAKPLIFLTRSASILDLDLVGPDETIIFCPANHSPPRLVEAYSGAPGYEALTSCLALPAVRARSQGVIAVRCER